MPYNETPFRLRAFPLDPAFDGTPQELFDAMVERTEIVSPGGFYGIVVSDVEPSANVGLWLQGGTKPYVWDENTNRYIPMDLSSSLTSVLSAITALQTLTSTHTTQITALQSSDTNLQTQITALQAIFGLGRVVFSATTPSADNRTKVLWVKTNTAGTTVLSFHNWDSGLNVWNTIVEFPITSPSYEDTLVYAEGNFDGGPALDVVIPLSLPTGTRWKDLDITMTWGTTLGAPGVRQVSADLLWNTTPETGSPISSPTTGVGYTSDVVGQGDTTTIRWRGVVPSTIRESSISLKIVVLCSGGIICADSRYEIVARAIPNV